MSVGASYWKQSANINGGLGAIDRMNEIIFGLIMVLTFTCTISAATGGHEELSTILWSALGCNVAWGFVDSMMYIFSILLERGETLANVRRIRSEKTDTKMKEALKDSLPPLISQLLKEEHIAHLGKEIRNLPEPPAKTFLTWHDIRDAALIFLMLFLSTFPVTLPFVFIKNVALALRVSNGIALLLLFLTGVYLGKQTGHHKILFGGLFASIGIMLVAVTIALGG